MNERVASRRSGATFGDVWPATSARSSTSAGQPGATTVPVTRAGEPRESVLLSRPSATERTISPRNQRISTETMEGKLLGHGTARYRFQPTETSSYYARLLTPGGEVTLWGRGLAQAISQSTTQVRIGDRVAFRRLDQDAQTGRVQWRAEKPEWFAAHDKAARRLRDEQLVARRAAREDPELALAMFPMKAARAFAERRLADPEQRLKFIASVAARIKQTIQQGRHSPTPIVRVSAEDQTPTQTRQAPRRRDPDRTR